MTDWAAFWSSLSLAHSEWEKFATARPCASLSSARVTPLRCWGRSSHSDPSTAQCT